MLSVRTTIQDCKCSSCHHKFLICNTDIFWKANTVQGYMFLYLFLLAFAELWATELECWKFFDDSWISCFCEKIKKQFSIDFVNIYDFTFQRKAKHIQSRIAPMFSFQHLQCLKVAHIYEKNTLYLEFFWEQSTLVFHFLCVIKTQIFVWYYCLQIHRRLLL